MSYLTDGDRAELTDWVFRYTDAKAISDPGFSMFERMVARAFIAGYWRAKGMPQPIIRTFKNEDLLRESPAAADGEIAYTIDKLIMWWGLNGEWVTGMPR